MEGGCGVMSGEDAMDVEAACMEVEQSAPTEVACEAVQLARRVVTSFLRGHRAEDIVPANSRVVIVDGAVSLRHALRALLDNGKDNTRRACGMRNDSF